MGQSIPGTRKHNSGLFCCFEHFKLCIGHINTLVDAINLGLELIALGADPGEYVVGDLGQLVESPHYMDNGFLPPQVGRNYGDVVGTSHPADHATFQEGVCQKAADSGWKTTGKRSVKQRCSLVKYQFY